MFTICINDRHNPRTFWRFKQLLTMFQKMAHNYTNCAIHIYEVIISRQGQLFSCIEKLDYKKGVMFKSLFCEQTKWIMVIMKMRGYGELLYNGLTIWQENDFSLVTFSVPSQQRTLLLNLAWMRNMIIIRFNSTTYSTYQFKCHLMQAW